MRCLWLIVLLVSISCGHSSEFKYFESRKIQGLRVAGYNTVQDCVLLKRIRVETTEDQALRRAVNLGADTVTMIFLDTETTRIYIIKAYRCAGKPKG
jgi:hypothetical protein